MTALPAFVAVLAVLLAFGDRLRRALGLAADRPAERLGLALAGAFATSTVAVFALAAARIANVGTLLGLLAAMAAAAGPAFRDLRAMLPLPRRGLLPALTAAALALGFVAALAPPTGIDTLILHFTAPARWREAGGLVPGDGLYAHRTGGFYFVYLLGMSLGGEILAKLLNFAAGAGAVALLGATAERRQAGAGIWAAAAAVASPVVTAYLGYEYLDLPALLYVAAGVYAAARGHESPRWSAAAVAILGFSLGVKTSNLAVLALAAAAGLALVRARAWAPLAAGAGTAALAAGFWPAWNLATLGTAFPTYVLAGTEGAPGPASVPAAVARVGLWLLGSPVYWSDALGPLVWIGLAAAALFRDLGARAWALQAAAGLALYFAVVAVAAPRYLAGDVHSQVRYLAPLLVGLGAPAAGLWLARLPRGWALALLLAPLLPLLALKAGRTAVALPAALGIEGRDAYLARKLETYEACRAVNALPGRPKVLALILRPYPLRPALWAPLDLTPDDLRSGRALERRMREAGCTHLLAEPGVLDAAAPGWLDGASLREIGSWPMPDGRRVRLYEVLSPGR
jgi:hypothetical protein